MRLMPGAMSKYFVWRDAWPFLVTASKVCEDPVSSRRLIRTPDKGEVSTRQKLAWLFTRYSLDDATTNTGNGATVILTKKACSRWCISPFIRQRTTMRFLGSNWSAYFTTLTRQSFLVGIAVRAAMSELVRTNEPPLDVQYIRRVISIRYTNRMKISGINTNICAHCKEPFCHQCFVDVCDRCKASFCNECRQIRRVCKFQLADSQCDNCRSFGIGCKRCRWTWRSNLWMTVSIARLLIWGISISFPTCT